MRIRANGRCGWRLRENAHLSGRDKGGAMVYLNYTGVVDITPQLGAILGGSPDAKSTDFGESCKPSLRRLDLPPLSHSRAIPGKLIIDVVIEMKFETGEEKFKELELGTFVGAGRFVVEHGKPVVVEYKISKVVA